MKTFSLYRVELRRLLLSKAVWIAAVLCFLSLLVGRSLFYEIDSVESMSIQFIANPVLGAATVGAVVWAVVMFLETSRPFRCGIDAITTSIASPVRLSAARMLAIATILAAVTVVCALLYLPYTAAKMEYLFDARFYLANYLIFLFPTWWISVFFAEAFYQVTCRIELSVLLYGVCVYFSFSGYASTDYFMRWINPYVVSYSDGFLSYWPLRVGLYTRLLWLCISFGVWLLSLLCIRRYQKNIAVSFMHGIRKFYLPIASVAMIMAGAGLWVSQPFIDHGPEEFVEEPEIDYPDTPDTEASAIRYSVTAEPLMGKIRGKAEYDIVKANTEEDLMLLNPGYKITKMSYGGEKVLFRKGEVVNGMCYIYYQFPDTRGDTFVVEYEGVPALANYSADVIVDESVDSDYIQLGSLAIVPSGNFTWKDGTVSIDITISGKLTPYLNYEPMEKYVDNGNGTKTWTAISDGFPVDFVAGNYVTDPINAAGMQIDFIYGTAYQEAVEKYEIRESIVEVFEYCKNHYGAMRLLEDNRLKLIQKSIMVMGGHAYQGISEWFETVLSPLTLSDPQRGASAREVFIHEMIHQWWGAYGLNCEDDGIWSEEGLTVYSTYRLVKEKYGELYARQYYVEEWEQAVEEQERNFYNRHPEYLSRLPKRYQAQLRSVNQSTNLYMRMPLMILKAEKLVGGEKKMDQILKRMYQDSEKYAYEDYFSYLDFLDYCGLSAKDLELK